MHIMHANATLGVKEKRGVLRRKEVLSLTCNDACQQKVTCDGLYVNKKLQVYSTIKGCAVLRRRESRNQSFESYSPISTVR